MTTIYKFDVGARATVQLPSTYDPDLHSLAGTLRKPNGDSLLVEPQISGLGASYVSTRGQLDVAGTYAYSVTITVNATGESRMIDPVFFRVWPRSRQGSH